MKKLILLIFLGSCANQKVLRPFIKGCIIGTINTYQNVAKDQWLQDWNMSAMVVCEELEKASVQNN